MKKGSRVLTKGEERRQRRAAARRAEILSGAAAIFKEKGYVKATTKEIADKADIAEGTIYKYFASKRDLLVTLLKEITDQTRAAIAAMPPGDPANAEQDLTQAFMFQFQIMKSHPFYALFVQEALQDEEIHNLFYTELLGPIVDEAQNKIAKWIEFEIGRPVDNRIAAQMITAILIGFDVLLNSSSDPYLDSLDPGHIGKCVADILINGLSNSERTGPKGK